MGKFNEIASTLKIVLFLTALLLLPGLLLTMTALLESLLCFPFVRKALSFQTLPPNQILIGISLFLTFFVMALRMEAGQFRSAQPYLKEDHTE